jgi:hypothetical protein
VAALTSFLAQIIMPPSRQDCAQGENDCKNSTAEPARSLARAGPHRRARVYEMMVRNEMIFRMSTPHPSCKRPEIEHVRKFVSYAKSHVNEARIYPPVEGYRYMVALALYSKCIT